MRSIPGPSPPKLAELARVRDRLTFIYVEHCVVNRDSNAITATDERGTVHIPGAALNVLLLGPGTTVTQQAIMLLAESGATAIWVGEQGVRYYAHGRSLARNARLLQAQAMLVTDRAARMRIARQMYTMRFEGEDVSGLDMQRLRGREGARVRRCYREHSRRTGVEWTRRHYQRDDFDASDELNQALSAATACLYGLVHAVVVALGLAPGLGFVHTGNERSFVFDVADLYKAETAIPIAFDVVAMGAEDVPSATRRRMRDRMVELKILERCVSDIYQLLEMADDPDDKGGDALLLWAGGPEDGTVAGGVGYGDDQ